MQGTTGVRIGMLGALLTAAAMVCGCALAQQPGLELTGGVRGEYRLFSGVAGSGATAEEWSAEPIDPDPALLAVATDECALGLDGHERLTGPVLQDQRGPDMALVLWDGDPRVLCIVERSADGTLGMVLASQTSPADSPTGQLAVDSGWMAPPTVVSGSVGIDADAVTIDTVSGLHLRATSGHGRWVAWWPGMDPPRTIHAIRADGMELAVLDPDPLIFDTSVFPDEPTSTDEPMIDGPQQLITASHVMFSPDHDAEAATWLPASDPAWVVAEARARLAADTLRAIPDAATRIAAFREIARTQGDDGSAEAGGALGEFGRDAMVPEFADALFDAPSPMPGDIIGPERTEFGWHVILYEGERIGEPVY